MNSTRVSVPSLAAGKYAAVLYDLRRDHKADEEDIRILRNIVEETPAFVDVLAHPQITADKKRRVMDRIVPASLRPFIGVMLSHGRIRLLKEMFAQYDRLLMEKAQIREAELLCAVCPSKERQRQMKEFICSRYGCRDVRLTVTQSRELLGGFLLRVGADEYDWSVKGRLDRMQEQLTRR